MLNILINWG